MKHKEDIQTIEEDIWTIKHEFTKEEERNEVPTLITLDMVKLLLIKGSLCITKAPYKDS